MFDPSTPIAFEPIPRLRRRFMGIRRKDVLRELESRDSAIEAFRKRAREVNSETERLRQRITELQDETDRAHEELEELRETSTHQSDLIGTGHSSKFCDCPPSDTMLEEMTKVVSMTEESTRKILEHARTTLMRDIDAAEALREQARAEIAQAAAWRSHWGPVVKAFQDTIRDTQSATAEIPERMREALAPLTAAAAALDHELLQFAGFGNSILGQSEGAVTIVLSEESAEGEGEASEASAETPAGTTESADEAAMPVSSL